MTSLDQRRKEREDSAHQIAELREKVDVVQQEKIALNKERDMMQLEIPHLKVLYARIRTPLLCPLL